MSCDSMGLFFFTKWKMRARGRYNLMTGLFILWSILFYGEERYWVCAPMKSTCNISLDV